MLSAIHPPAKLCFPHLCLGIIDFILCCTGSQTLKTRTEISSIHSSFFYHINFSPRISVHVINKLNQRVFHIFHKIDHFQVFIFCSFPLQTLKQNLKKKIENIQVT